MTGHVGELRADMNSRFEVVPADIDAEVWESLHRTVSRPFEAPETGMIAVKVINDYGDEVMKVHEIA